MCVSGRRSSRARASEAIICQVVEPLGSSYRIAPVDLVLARADARREEVSMSGNAPDENTRRVEDAMVSYANRRLAKGTRVAEVDQELVERGLDRERAALLVQKVVTSRLREVASEVPSGPTAGAINWAARAQRDGAHNDIVLGAVICAAGVLFTAITYSAAKGGGTYVVAWGAIVFGAIRMFKGMANLDSVPALASDATYHAPGADGTPQSPPGLDLVVVLLMPQDQLSARVSANELVGLTRLVERNLNSLFASDYIEIAPLSLFVLVKPGKRMKIWVEGIDRQLRPQDTALLEAQSNAWQAPDVRDTIALAYTWELARTQRNGPPQLPSAWRDAARAAGKTLDLPDGLAAAVWPD